MPRRLFDVPQIDPGVIDAYFHRSRQERSRALAEMVRSIFSAPGRPSAEVRALPSRRHEPAGQAPCKDRAA